MLFKVELCQLNSKIASFRDPKCAPECQKTVKICLKMILCAFEFILYFVWEIC